MFKPAHLVRIVLFAVLVSGCSASDRDGEFANQNGAENHPIRVEPSYQSLRLGYAGGLADADAARLDAFVAAYRDHGNGSIAVSAPASARGAGLFFADRINQMGVARDHIILAAHDAPNGDMRVEINYVAYEARTDSCADWSDNLAITTTNGTARNFGCSVQQNLAAMIADPRDLIAPRPMDGADANRRADVITNYQHGQPTAATKTADQTTQPSGLSQ